MLFTIGSRVRLKSTGDIGKVTEFISDGLVRVALDNGLGTIPVPPEALVREHKPEEDKKRGGARFVRTQAVENTEVEPPTIDLGYTILQPWGVQLGFDPVQRTEGAPDRYRVFLINDTGQPLIFSAKLLLGKQSPVWHRIGQLAGVAYFELGDLKHQELNDMAAIELEVRPKQEGGTGAAHQQLLKIKPKQFFKNFITAPLLNRKVYHFVVFPTWKEAKPTPPTKQENLKNYTKRVAESGKAAPNHFLKRVSITPNPARLAAFPRTIDLHIEQLLKDPSSLPKYQYLGFQLGQCQQYLREARQLGLDSVFVIHGVGEGKLKAALAKMLEEMDGIASFRNDFHPLYGHGATEVFFY